MYRRELLKTAGASLAALAAPRTGRAERPRKLVFVPTSDLNLLDPVATFFRPTRNHGYLVFDTLYGIDTSWTAQPQMVEGHQVDEDGLIWTLTLREGLRFHDNEPVLARDVVASIRRFAARIGFTNALLAATEELSAPDDRTVHFRLKRPFPHPPEALAGPGGTSPRLCRSVWRQPRPSSLLPKSSAAAPIAFCRMSMSAVPAPPTNASSSIGRVRQDRWVLLRDQRSHISTGSSG
jgi:peptide/nickel transport system substrate-binding protein